ncbi:peptide-methionine (S)-S-oxide reductase MsrA [Paenimyroides aestuarii]|uniref:Peptide methionine sulfoxide reductase MsrA n=1 Tax=Paenimyroides aestuarii TaxID=2968490 RepID=A0ABY5NRW5_9FLAO|nr:peptide-methionine (S)-S-oxide reductase MsrA [Paenimyroides aestuarii]UUV21316.1 peptide-methionine (S)-S-oxide reductase MsrA [Paenimyroides aestuarii]
MTVVKEQTAIFANGCFWCSEAIFQKINGVKEVLPGYIGGTTENPTYEEVCTGQTNHAEAIKIVFNEELVSYQELLEVFFATHDPTTLNRQGNDIGTQYRSEIFYTNGSQKEQAMLFVKILNEENIFEKKVVTKVSKADTFYLAENYHQNYFNNNPEKSYCAMVVSPKVKKFEKFFQEHITK